MSTQLDKKKKKKRESKRKGGGERSSKQQIHYNQPVNFNLNHNSTFVSGGQPGGGGHTTVDILAEDDLVD